MTAGIPDSEVAEAVEHPASVAVQHPARAEVARQRARAEVMQHPARAEASIRISFTSVQEVHLQETEITAREERHIMRILHRGVLPMAIHQPMEVREPETTAEARTICRKKSNVLPDSMLLQESII